ncbi:hypothetical protein D3C86_770010 [compost metagenome]
MLADFGTAGDPDARRHGSVISHLNVVGNLNLVIELHAVTDDRIGQRTAIYSRVHADFNIIADQHTTDLGDFLPDTFFIGKAEAFTAEHCTRLNDNPFADANVVIQGHPRCEPATLTHHAASANEAMRADSRTGCNLRTAFDHHKSADTRRWIDNRIRRDHRRRMNPGCRLGLGIEQVRNTRVGCVRIRHHQHIPAMTFGVSGLEQQGCSLTACQVLAVLGVCEKAQLSWASLLQGG